MEKNTKHRILGLLIILGLFVILLPLFQANHDEEQPVIVKAPSFPEEHVAKSSANEPLPLEQPAVNIAQNNNSVTMQPDDTIPASSTASQAIPVASQEQPKPADIAQTATNTAPIATNGTSASSTPATDLSTEQSKQTETPTQSTIATAEIKDTSVDSHKTHLTNAKHFDFRPKPYIPDHPTISRQARLSNKPLLPEDGLYQLKTAAWIIHVGTFNHKANGLAFAKKMQAEGFPVLIQTVALGKASGLDVYIGPAANKIRAASLTQRLSKKNIHGVMISYKPVL